MVRRGMSPAGTGLRDGKPWRRTAAACILVATVLISCSGAPATATNSPETSTLPVGGAVIPTEESTVPETVYPQTPTVGAQGVYPLPESSNAENTPSSKAAATPGSNSVFLPAIVNEKPADYPFVLQQSGVIPMQGFYGCNWTGVAGLIFDLQGIDIKNLILHLEGSWAGKAVSAEALSGSATQYGPSGYEFVLGNQPMDSKQSLWVQVFDATHKEISARVYLDTYNDCTRNLILVNFNQVR